MQSSVKLFIQFFLYVETLSEVNNPDSFGSFSNFEIAWHHFLKLKFAIITYKHMDKVSIFVLGIILVNAVLQKSDEQEQAPPDPWCKHILSWILVQDRTTPLCKPGCRGCKIKKNKNFCQYVLRF